MIAVVFILSAYFRAKASATPAKLLPNPFKNGNRTCYNSTLIFHE